MVILKPIRDFISNKDIAVIGVSLNKKKFGHIIFNCMLKHGFNAIPVNPGVNEINGVKCYPGIASLPQYVKAIIFVTKPVISEQIAQQLCENKTIEYVWFQQGSESSKAIEIAKTAGKNVIHDECILMYIKPVGFPHSIHRLFRKIFGTYPK